MTSKPGRATGSRRSTIAPSAASSAPSRSFGEEPGDHDPTERAIDFEGDSYRYTGVTTASRPVQEHLPLKIGAMGAAAYVSGPYGTWEGGAGLANVAGHIPMTPDVRSHVGSVSKLWTATVVVKLAQEGKLRLDDTVWHGLYNLATGAAGATATIQAVTSTFVYVQAFLLVGLELRARRHGEASMLGPREGGAPPSKRPALSTP
jgi:CubicO group peptidase (beta-lactamase class C family)